MKKLLLVCPIMPVSMDCPFLMKIVYEMHRTYLITDQHFYFSL